MKNFKHEQKRKRIRKLAKRMGGFLSNAWIKRKEAIAERVKRKNEKKKR